MTSGIQGAAVETTRQTAILCCLKSRLGVASLGKACQARTSASANTRTYPRALLQSCCETTLLARATWTLSLQLKPVVQVLIAVTVEVLVDEALALDAFIEDVVVPAGVGGPPALYGLFLPR